MKDEFPEEAEYIEYSSVDDSCITCRDLKQWNCCCGGGCDSTFSCEYYNVDLGFNLCGICKSFEAYSVNYDKN